MYCSLQDSREKGETEHYRTYTVLLMLLLGSILLLQEEVTEGMNGLLQKPVIIVNA